MPWRNNWTKHGYLICVLVLRAGGLVYKYSGFTCNCLLLQRRSGLKESFPCTFIFAAFTSPQSLLTNGLFEPEEKDFILFLLWSKSPYFTSVAVASQGQQDWSCAQNWSVLGGPVENTGVDILYSLGTAYLRTGVRSGPLGETARIWQTLILYGYPIITSELNIKWSDPSMSFQISGFV